MATTRVNGAALRVIRERSEMSIRDVVEALAREGLRRHPDYIRNIELGHKQPSAKLAAALARALHVPKVVLFAPPADAPQTEDVA